MESCFTICLIISRVILLFENIVAFKNVGGRSMAKNYCPVSLLSVVSKILKNL